MGNPLPLNLAQECRKADKILKEFVDPVNGLDKIIPLAVLRRAKGFAIFSIFRVGFVLTARAGSGVVIAKLEDGSWSAPSALGIGGIGGGFSAGAEVTDFIVVLNSRAAVKSFMSTGSLQLGGNLSLAVGPLGRSAEASGSVSGGGVAAMFSYSKSQGLFGGVSLEGTVLVDRSDANGKAYHRSASAKQILSGSIDVPTFAAGLIGTIERLSLTGSMAQSARADELEPGAGRDSWSIDGELEDEWGSPASRRGKESSSKKSDLDADFRRSSLAQPAADPFAASEYEDDPAYSLDRDNATRNAGTYSFSSAGGGSVTNSPSAVKTPGESRQRSGSKSSKIGSYFDELVGSKESRAYSPLDGKRPPMSHRKSSSSFSLSRFTKGKTPPPFGARNTPPVSDALLNNRFPEEPHDRREQMSSSEDEFSTDFRETTPARSALTASDYGSARRSPRHSPISSSRPGLLSRNSGSAYSNGGLKKMTPAEAVLAAARSDAPPPSAAKRANGRPADAFDDLWQAERSHRAPSGSSKFSDLDELDRELQGVALNGRGTAQRGSTFGSGNGNRPTSSSYSRYDRPGSSSPQQGFRTGSAGPSKAVQAQRDAWLGFEGSSSEEEGNSAAPTTSFKPPHRGSSTTPRGLSRLSNGRAVSASPSASRSITPAAAAAVNAAPSSMPIVARVAAAFDFAGQESDDLSFSRGDVIAVLRRTESANDWWLGRNEATGQIGSFPANFTEPLDDA
ncbi:unnamed protein product [Parajaminaea phylloscopi]